MTPAERFVTLCRDRAAALLAADRLPARLAFPHSDPGVIAETSRLQQPGGPRLPQARQPKAA
jgi:hypothetical protein